MKKYTGAEIRRGFIDFFEQHGHTFVASSSLVPGGDATLLFTNAGMVQFKDVFLGTDLRPYTRAVNSQKCMRVAGKHNDLDEVGRDDSHHTFFEMLGNWSFGDYYKKDAIQWAWELLTKVWGLDKSKLWATCFKDDKGNIPTDEEAGSTWLAQPGIIAGHVVYFGRKDNFWEMAEVGPCGPCSEIHIDRGIEFCDKQGAPGHVCSVNGDCKRFLEIWNLVFIQYNRLSVAELVALPATHVDTGMGFERIVSILQGVDSNYRTDLLLPLVETVRQLTGESVAQRDANFTPYRVIADHARAAAFLIADGVVPGNIGRNYICRMIIRRAARFGMKLGLNDPFMAKVADAAIVIYGEAYPELVKNRATILDNLEREEKRFQRTVEAGLGRLDELLADLKLKSQKILDGESTFNLYATLGLPFEITRDIAREQELDVDEAGFQAAMDAHRLASGGGKAMGVMGGEDVDLFRAIFRTLTESGKLETGGVSYDPYRTLEVNGEVLALIKDGVVVTDVEVGDAVEVVLPATCFYVESGGQIADSGWIRGLDGSWEIEVVEVRKPAAGILIHVGKVTRGQPQVDDLCKAVVDQLRRQDIMRNHTATHLLHAALQQVLGDHARQAGSLVAPDHLRFDFTHPNGMTAEELEQVEGYVNHAILDNFRLKMVTMPLTQAIDEGATALFGEKYGEIVRTIAIGGKQPFSYELCGGTHVDETGDIGLFLISSEGSAAFGVRRIEATSGRTAYEIVAKRMRVIKQSAGLLSSPVEEISDKIEALLVELDQDRKQIVRLRQELVSAEFNQHLLNVSVVNGVPVLAVILDKADSDALRQMADRFRQSYPSGVVALASTIDGRPALIVAVTDDLVKRGLNAGEIARSVAQVIGGSGGGRPNLAQAGGKDASRLGEAMALVPGLVASKLG